MRTAAPSGPCTEKTCTYARVTLPSMRGRSSWASSDSTLIAKFCSIGIRSESIGASPRPTIRMSLASPSACVRSGLDVKSRPPGDQRFDVFDIGDGARHVHRSLVVGGERAGPSRDESASALRAEFFDQPFAAGDRPIAAPGRRSRFRVCGSPASWAAPRRNRNAGAPCSPRRARGSSRPACREARLPERPGCRRLSSAENASRGITTIAITLPRRRSGAMQSRTAASLLTSRMRRNCARSSATGARKSSSLGKLLNADTISL